MINNVSQLSTAIESYRAYRDMGAVEDFQTITDPKVVRDSAYSSLQNKEIGKDNEKMLEKLLRQPVMADIYASNGISPRDVPAYIDNVMSQSDTSKRAMLAGFASAYNEAAISMHEEKIPVVDGDRELRSLRAHIELQSQIRSSLKEFSEQRQPAKSERNKTMVKLKEGVGRWFEKAAKKVLGTVALTAVVLGAGKYATTMLSEKGQEYIKNDLAKDNNKAKDPSTLQMVAKDKGQHQA